MKIRQISAHYLLLLFVFLVFTSQKGPTTKKTKNVIPEKPELVITIVVEQMRYDHLYRYWDKFGKDGFKRLVNEGFHCKNTSYNFLPIYTASAHAAIFTGGTPSVNGITGNEWYDSKQDSMINSVTDKGFATIGSFNTLGERSPRKMLTTTLADELRRTSNMQSRSIGISIKDKNAIIPVGHTASAAYWLDVNGNGGKWISSSYYMKELPEWVLNFNAKKISSTYLGQPWKTLLPIANYTESTADNMSNEKAFSGELRPVFPHDLPKIKENEKDLLTKTPFGNSFTKDFAIETIRSERLGKGKFADFLSISFSATDQVGQQFGPNSIEMQDTYLRLDKDIAELLKFIDNYLWKGNVLVILTSDNVSSPNAALTDSLKLPLTSYNERSIRNDLEQFLEKTYGKDKGKQKASWVLSVRNQQVYLNPDLAIRKKINFEDLQRKSSDFLLNIPGVSKTYIAEDLRKKEFSQLPGSAVQNGYHTKRSGDVIIVPKVGELPGSVSAYYSHVPLVWYGWKIKQGESTQSINITDIAPTIADFMNISRPNGCTGNPIEGLIK